MASANGAERGRPQQQHGARSSVRRGAAESAERTLHCIVCCPRIADQAGSAIAHVSGDHQPEGQGCRRLWRGAAYSESGALFGSKVVSPGQGYPPCVLKPGPGVATKKAPRPTPRAQASGSGPQQPRLSRCQAQNEKQSTTWSD